VYYDIPRRELQHQHQECRSDYRRNTETACAYLAAHVTYEQVVEAGLDKTDSDAKTIRGDIGWLGRGLRRTGNF
jgi:hypothetical protein